MIMRKIANDQIEEFFTDPPVPPQEEKQEDCREGNCCFPEKKTGPVRTEKESFLSRAVPAVIKSFPFPSGQVRTEKESFLSRAVPAVIVFALFAAILFAGISDAARQNKVIARYTIGEQTPTGNRDSILIDGTPGEEYVAGKTFYATVSGKKYHENKDCRYIKGRNIREADSREILSGTLKPCSACVGKGSK